VLGLFIDTCVWIDIAGRRDGQKLIVPLRVLKHLGKLELFVPNVVIDEFERNRPLREPAVTRSVRDQLRQLVADARRSGANHQHEEWLEAMAYHLPLVSAGVMQNFSEVAELLRNGRSVTPTAEEYARVVQRGLEKKAPLHLNKNSVADALLIELYATLLRSGDENINQYCFATSNHQDFSVVNGDHRQPHPDLGDLFSEESSRYTYSAEGLHELLMDYFGDEYLEEVEEVESLQTEPRSLAEILEAEQEYFDKIWYVRKLITKEKIAAGETEPLSEDLAAKVDEGMREVEQRYGAENVGPWDDWNWGFVHGKLSALRWVLGDEWDFLDT